MSISTWWHAAVAACVMALAVPSVSASVVLGGTRIIYPATEREVALRLGNDGPDPALVQTWIDDGDASILPDDAQVPFMLTPPLFRLDAGKGQTLRIVHTGEPLARDRESLFWLNVLEVPPLATASDSTNSLQLAFRSRIKLFYRPAGLRGDASQAPAAVTWRFVRGEDGRHTLTATNPTPYHVTFSRITVHGDDAAYRSDTGAMVAPGETTEIDIDPAAKAHAERPGKVVYTAVNDYGAGVEGTSEATANR